MSTFRNTSGNRIVLDTSAFGTDNILDVNSSSAQKAFEDIAERLQLADFVYDGLMSTEDKQKLDNIESENASKGDILVHDGTSYKKLPAGTDGQYLVVDSTTDTGLKWIDLVIG